jgi:hypothetical protein
MLEICRRVYVRARKKEAGKCAGFQFSESLFRFGD